MDIVQFQEFLNVLVSLQAQGLDAQHLIDEAKKAGKEEAMKEMAPVETPVPVVSDDVAAIKAELEMAKLEIAKVMSDDEADKAAIVALGEKLSKIAAILNPVVIAPIEEVPVVEAPIEEPVV